MKPNLLNITIAAIALCTTLCPAADTAITIKINEGSITGLLRNDQDGLYQTNSTGLANGGRAQFSFTVTNAGSYLIRTTVKAPNTEQNSFYVNIDGTPIDPAMIWDIPITQGFEQRDVSWRGFGTPEKDEFAPKLFQLSAGSHTLVLVGREANVQVKALSLAIDSAPAPKAPQNLRVVSVN